VRSQIIDPASESKERSPASGNRSVRSPCLRRDIPVRTYSSSSATLHQGQSASLDDMLRPATAAPRAGQLADTSADVTEERKSSRRVCEGRRILGGGTPFWLLTGRSEVRILLAELSVQVRNFGTVQLTETPGRASSRVFSGRLARLLTAVEVSRSPAIPGERKSAWKV
jgi:hypothetical protein